MGGIDKGNREKRRGIYSWTHLLFSLTTNNVLGLEVFLSLREKWQKKWREKGEERKEGGE